MQHKNNSSVCLIRWVLSTMRRNNELTGEKELSSQYTVEVVEVPAPKSVPSSSSVDGKHIMPAPRAKMFHSPVTKSMSSRDLDEDSTLLGDGAFDTIGEPIAAPEIDTSDMEGDLGVGDRVIEDTPIEAWYRVVYHVRRRFDSPSLPFSLLSSILSSPPPCLPLFIPPSIPLILPPCLLAQSTKRTTNHLSQPLLQSSVQCF